MAMLSGFIKYPYKTSRVQLGVQLEQITSNTHAGWTRLEKIIVFATLKNVKKHNSNLVLKNFCGKESQR